VVRSVHARVSDPLEGERRTTIRIASRGSRSLRGVCAVSLSALLLAEARPAFATLGEMEASIDNDRVHLQGARTSVAAGTGFTVHEMITASGATVREYVAQATGRVFAVAWQGPRQPDFRQVFGTYFEQYVQAAQAARGNHARRGPLAIEQPGLVVEMGGQPRAFYGRAYIPQLMPQGMEPGTIR